MTTEKYEQLRQKIIEANPSIEDLVFGCEMFFSHNTHEHLIFIRFTNLPYNEEAWEQIEAYNLLEPQEICTCNVREVTIIGRPIRLTDVLLVVMKVKETNDYMPNIEDEMYFGIKREGGFAWDLKKDSLDEQSDECKEFLYSLLVAGDNDVTHEK